jgi:hypothetical protein
MVVQKQPNARRRGILSPFTKGATHHTRPPTNTFVSPTTCAMRKRKPRRNKQSPSRSLYSTVKTQTPPDTNNQHTEGRGNSHLFERRKTTNKRKKWGKPTLLETQNNQNGGKGEPSLFEETQTANKREERGNPASLGRHKQPTQKKWGTTHLFGRHKNNQQRRNGGIHTPRRHKKPTHGGRGEHNFLGKTQTSNTQKKWGNPPSLRRSATCVGGSAGLYR